MPEASRPTPFDLVFGPEQEERFQALRAALQQAGADRRDRDAFLMVREVAEFLHELRPEEGLGEAIEELVAFVHLAYLFWDDGGCVARLDRRVLDLLTSPEPVEEETMPPAAFYLQLPERRVWGTPRPDSPPEPLDGLFLGSVPGLLRAVAIFGLHAQRGGFTVVEVMGPRPGALARPDGSALFAPILPGGAEAGLASVTGGEELLELAWRGAGLMASRGSLKPGLVEVSA